MSEKDLYQTPQVDVPWMRKRMLHWGTCKRLERQRNSQGKDPRIFDGNRQVGDLSTPQSKQPGKGPKNLQRTSGKVASSEEAKGEEVEKTEEEKG